jgi:hypothetical protein
VIEAQLRHASTGLTGISRSLYYQPSASGPLVYPMLTTTIGWGCACSNEYLLVKRPQR